MVGVTNKCNIRKKATRLHCCTKNKGKGGLLVKEGEEGDARRPFGGGGEECKSWILVSLRDIRTGPGCSN